MALDLFSLFPASLNESNLSFWEVLLFILYFHCKIHVKENGNVINLTCMIQKL